ncbi:MAG: protein phosphatase CheZ [Methylomonas sp.]|jgi:chemotaxis protein CheZ
MQIHLLSLSKDLVTALECGDQSSVDEILEKIASIRKTQLFQEIGILTRQLHDTMISFSSDSAITALAQTEIPDAKERLQYVITMTEQAANQTLAAIEDLLPVSEQLNHQAQALSGKWGRFLDKEMPFEEFKAMSHEISRHFEHSQDSLDLIQSGLNDILLAQGFQDITGQIIRRVIDLVKNVETGLVKIISISECKNTGPAAQTHLDLPGPVVPGIDDKGHDVATNQDDVDDLLSSLGF